MLSLSTRRNKLVWICFRTKVKNGIDMEGVASSLRGIAVRLLHSKHVQMLNNISPHKGRHPLTTKCMSREMGSAVTGNTQDLGQQVLVVGCQAREGKTYFELQTTPAFRMSFASSQAHLVTDA